MAITVPLTDAAANAADGVSTLVVVGIDEAQRPRDAAAKLQALFEQHSRSAGLAFVPQGTPTNNTETVASGYRRVEAELADLEAAGARMSTSRRRRQRDAAGVRSRPARRRAVRPARVRRRPASTRRAGHAHRAVRGRVRHVRPRSAGDPRRRRLGARTGLGDQTIDALRTWFVTWLTGGAPVPSVRVGDQPYGILPVMPRAGVDHSTADEAAHRQRHRRADRGVAPRPVAPCRARPQRHRLAAARPAARSPTPRPVSSSPRVLANNPHPRRLAVRSATDWSDQPRPVVEGPGGIAGRAATGGGATVDLGGSDGGNRTDPRRC